MSALKKITIAVLLIIFSMVSYKIIRHHSRDIKIGEEAVYSDYKSFVFVTVIPEKITPQWQQAFDAIAREFDTKEHYQIHVIVPDNFEEKNTLNRESIKYITLGSLSTQSFYHSDLFLKLPQYAQLWSFGVAHMLDFPHSGLYSPESLVYLHQHAHNSREFFGYVTGFVESFGYYIYQVGPLPGHFALSPNMMFFHEDDYSKEWVLLIRQ
ncbi:MAG: hypothetical protein FJ161_05230, partial [Gammaproteobacteria bacterium]|nr:hypothetical protein [Gammaproteobacteria bacterium]